ncbi:dCTP deaminase domain-containing protein [Nocardia lijiangensis]|uniref:dCTP deaminase n=1 Tax=Nocardia lijiangensis TaxID=299618 RepID=UPI003D70E4A5
MTILTGAEIHRQREVGAITIEPFDPERLNPNSYNFTLGPRVRAYTVPVLDSRIDNPSTEITIPADGLILQPGQLYLATTAEILGGTRFAPTFAARSSIARLGLSIHLSSGLGDIGFVGQWTLQLVATQPVRVYAGMEIGQMMWWTPVGEIACYNGKYQHSQGPQTSKAWVGLAHDLGRRRFPSIGDLGMNPALVGTKCARLVELAERVPVPTLVAVPVGEFDAAMPSSTRDALAAAFTDLEVTVGADVNSHVTRLADVLCEVRMTRTAADLMTTQLQVCFPEGTRFAVRSSAIGEDSATASFAGAYESLLGVAVEDVPAAVAVVWRSYYSLTAVSARLRAGDLDPTPRMAVIVQAMVEPDLAGIAMTGLDPHDPDHLHIEAIRGRADALAAGVAVPDKVAVLPHTVRAAIGEAVHAASEVLGCSGVDVEWVLADGVLSLVQARPNTSAARDRTIRDEIAVHPLYDQPLPPNIPLGPLAPTATHFMTKRGPAMRRAADLGIARGNALVVYIPPKPQPGWVQEVIGLLDSATTRPQVIIDVSAFERQIVCATDELPHHLQRLRSATPSADPLTVLVRDYVTGQRALITRTAGNGEVIAETSVDGLLAMNRGFAETSELHLAQLHDLFGNVNATLIATLTRDLDAMLGQVAVEWVLSENTLFYIDHTVLGTTAHDNDAAPSMIAPGRCTGRVVRAHDDDALQQLSIGAAISVTGEAVDIRRHRAVANLVARINKVRASGDPVIVSASRPYAILAALVHLVDGFVFDLGSHLCHLGIVVRESRLPAVVHRAGDGDLLTLDHGTVLDHGRKP